MTKILFVLENLAERCGANVNIAMVLAKQLSKEFEVHALARYDDMKQISDEQRKAFNNVYAFYADQPGKLAKFTSQDWSKASGITRVMRFCRNPNMFISMIDAKYFDFSITKKKCKKAIEDVCSKETYDAVIAVSAPYYIMQAVAEANIDYAKMALQLDPFTNNYTLSPRLKNRRRRNELRTINKMRTVFAGDYLYSDLLSVVTKADNIVATPLPGLICDNMKVQARVFDNNTQMVNFLFVGQFYEKIRNPHYLLELFTYLPSNYILHIVGGGCDKELERYTKILGNRLVRHGWVSKEEANAYIEQFDVLVNVNNTITNQLPSKLFEYISTGKPILNIAKSDMCLSKPYLENYLNGINIIEEQDSFACNSKSIVDFIDANLHRVLSKDEILDIFWVNTDVYVAGIVENGIKIK